MAEPRKSGFCDLLQQWMGDRTRAAAARVLMVSWDTIDNWLKGEAVPPSTRVPLLAMLMGVSVEQIRAALDAPAAESASTSVAGTEPEGGVGACPQAAGVGT